MVTDFDSSRIPPGVPGSIDPEAADIEPFDLGDEELQSLETRSSGLYEISYRSSDSISFADSTVGWEHLDLLVGVIPHTRQPTGFQLAYEKDNTILTYREVAYSFNSFEEGKSHFFSLPLLTEPRKPFDKAEYLNISLSFCKGRVTETPA